MTTQGDLQLAAERDEKVDAEEVGQLPSWATSPARIGMGALVVLAVLAA